MFASGWGILHYDGESWEAMPGSGYYPIWGVWGSSGSDVFGAGSEILRYDGSEWRVMETAPRIGFRSFRSVWGTTGTDVLVVGDDGIILHYSGDFDLTRSGKAVSAARAEPGALLTYTIAVRNTGDLPTPLVQVKDDTPHNATYVTGTVTSTQGTVQSVNPLLVDIGEVGAGQVVTITFQATVGDPGPACWFLTNDALLVTSGITLTRRAVTAVGTCHAIYLPLITRGAMSP